MRHYYRARRLLRRVRRIMSYMMTPISTPVNFCTRLHAGPLEVFRCQTDGMLVTKKTAYGCGKHGGHRVVQPVKVTVPELLGIWIGVIR